MLVGVTDDLAQVASQILAGEGEGASRQVGGARLALGGRSGGGDIPAKAGAGGGGGGGGGGGRRQGCRAGRPAEGIQRLGRGRGGWSLVEEVVVVMVGRGRMVQGSGAVVLDRLGRARLEGLLQLCHVVGILGSQTRKTKLAPTRGDESGIKAAG